MKTLALAIAFCGCAHAQTAVSARVTAESLAALRAKSPMSKLTTAPAAPKPDTTPSIIRESVILHDGANWTLVPESAVLHVPANLKHRINTKPVGKIMPWVDFLVANRGWLTTENVSFDEAAGNTAIDTKRAETWQKSDRIIVATHQNGPISVRAKELTPTLASK
jgi:hypothetical protein